jgi:hypothetical protein
MGNHIMRPQNPSFVTGDLAKFVVGAVVAADAAVSE